MTLKHLRICVAYIIAATICSSTAKFENNVIKGFISPASAALAVWAISPDETVKADVTNGSFEFNSIKEGTYNIRVQATAPYEDVTKEGIRVQDGAQVNLGEIKLERLGGLSRARLGSKLPSVK